MASHKIVGMLNVTRHFNIHFSIIKNKKKIRSMLMVEYEIKGLKPKEM